MGHFVSKDFVHWAALPVAVWNGLDVSHAPGEDGYVTKYDNEAIFTGSGVVIDGAAPDGKSPGMVQIYPGLCNKKDWPGCETGTLLAQAVPADYENDELLTNWTKPSYNPIMENTQRDPATPWQMPSGEWRLRTYDAKIYGTASSSDMLAGKWYEIGTSSDFRQCECPSFYPLPNPTPGTEKMYHELQSNGELPTHVHKTSCGGDWWQMGTYAPGAPKVLSNFTATKGWEDLFVQRRIDFGKFYASKDNLYPTLEGGDRRINWGWAMVKPGSTQTLPREITFNAAARQLQQYPIQELESLRESSVYSQQDVSLTKGKGISLGIEESIALTSEMVAIFVLPTEAATFGVTLGPSGGSPPTPAQVTTYMEKTDLPGDDYSVTHMPIGTNNAKVCEANCNDDDKCMAWTYVVRGSPAGSGDCCLKGSVPCPSTSGGASAHCTSGAKKKQVLPSCGKGASGVDCTVAWEGRGNSSVPFVNVPVACGTVKDTLRVLSSEKTLTVHIFADVTFQEVYFQQGRTAMTVNNIMSKDDDYMLTTTTEMMVQEVEVWPMGSPWIDEEAVRKAPRVYK